jgi:hypothetical protein
MNKRWYPVLIAGAVLVALALAAIPLFFMAYRANQAARLEAEAARHAAKEEENELRGELDRLTAKTDRALAHPEKGDGGVKDLVMCMGQTQGLLFNIRQGRPRPALLAEAEALSARQRKAWARLTRRVKQPGEGRKAE